MSDRARSEITREQTPTPSPKAIAWSPRARPVASHWLALRDAAGSGPARASQQHVTRGETGTAPAASARR